MPCDHLVELLRIAQQDQAARRGRHGDRVGERELARLIDDQHIDGLPERPAGPRPRRCPHDIHRPPVDRGSHAVVRRQRDGLRARGLAPVARQGAVPGGRPCPPRVPPHRSSPAACRSPCGSWPSRRPCVPGRPGPAPSGRRCTSCRCPAGPGWADSCPASATASRRAASTAGSVAATRCAPGSWPARGAARRSRSRAARYGPGAVEVRHAGHRPPDASRLSSWAARPTPPGPGPASAGGGPAAFAFARLGWCRSTVRAVVIEATDVDLASDAPGQGPAQDGPPAGRAPGRGIGSGTSAPTPSTGPISSSPPNGSFSPTRCSSV